MICIYLLGKMPQVIIVGKYVVELFSPHTFFPMSSSSANASSPLWIYHFQLPNFPRALNTFIHHSPNFRRGFHSTVICHIAYIIYIYILKSFSFSGFSGFFPFKTKKMPRRMGKAYMMALNDSLAAKALPWHWDQRCRLGTWRLLQIGEFHVC